MTKFLRFGAAGAAIFAVCGAAPAFAQDTATADATAEVLQALNLSLDSGTLDFGAIVVNGADTLTLTPAGTMDCANKQVVCAGTTDVPTFEVTGTDGAAVTINLPTANVNLVVAGGSAAVAEETLVLNNFTSSANGTNGPEATLTGGSALFTVGGTLNIGANQDAGVYTGTFDVSVEYS